jgi:recombination protein RecR
MNALPKPITDAIEALCNLPGIGTRSAERLVFYLLKNPAKIDQKIGQALLDLKKNIKECLECCHLSENEKCSICENPSRDQNIICIVETPLDLLALEKTHEFRGKYHVLHGVISPLDRVGIDDLRISELLTRVKSNPEIKEVIIATSGTTESEATAMFIREQLNSFFRGKISRLARGIPTGGDLDYLDAGTLSKAMVDRREF